MIDLNNAYYIFNMSFAICSFFFFILLLIIYFHKCVNYSLKNILYRRMIFVGIFEFLFNFTYLVLIRCSKDLFYIGLVQRFMFLGFILLMILWIYYVIIIVFEKNSDVSSFIRQHHRTIDYNLLFVMMAITGIEMFLPLKISYEQDLILTVTGAGVLFPYILISILLVIPIPFILYQKCGFQKNLLPYYVIDILLIILGLISLFYPMISLAGFVVTISGYLIYYRLENPDIVYIRNYYKDHERLRSLREKYGFLFNMSPELRDLLNEVSFMKDNYLVDEKKRISKKKLEALISDFIKSGEIGETTKTNIDDDGIEILDLEDDIPEEMLVTKEIYSLKELQDILKEDNLPKW